MLYDFSFQKKLTVRDASQLAAHHGLEDSKVEQMSPTRTRNSYRIVSYRYRIRASLRSLHVNVVLLTQFRNCVVYEILGFDFFKPGYILFIPGPKCISSLPVPVRKQF
jgi:hypothetical protein